MDGIDDLRAKGVVRFPEAAVDWEDTVTTRNEPGRAEVVTVLGCAGGGSNERSGT